MKDGSFLASDWYRAAPLRPRLRGHVEIHRQRFRGETWHIVQDLHSGRYHRISPAANLMVSLMDGRRTMQRLWELACERFPDDPPTQSETIRLLAQLHNSDLIAGDLPPDIAEMGRRHHDQRRRSMLALIRNPLALRLPLFDPDAVLDATVGLVRPVFTVWGFLAWLLLVATGVVLATLNWSALTENVADQVLSAQNLALIALVYPMVKFVHELGHAYATKVWGGEVHEVGFMFLVFIPVPYVDASSAAAFPEKSRRAVVGGAGIMVELGLAALAMIFWANAEPGLARAFAFNVMLIGGVSTLLFNGNPLLRFDGYFVMADLLEIPNFGQRSNTYFWFLVQRHLLGVKDADNPVTARGEAGWFLFYSVAAFLYRVAITVGIALFVAGKFFFVGVLLALWTLTTAFVLPAFKGLKFLLASPRLRGRRLRAWSLAAGAGAGVAALLVLVPVPHGTVAEGVVWLDESSILRVRTEGFVEEVALELGEVNAGAVLVRLADPALDSQARLVGAQLEEVRLRLAGVLGSDPVATSLLREQERHLLARQALLQARQDALVVTASHEGRAVIPQGSDLAGRLIRQGEIVGYLLPPGAPRLRVAVPQGRAELVRSDTRAVEVRLLRDTSRALPARIVAAAPEAVAMLPSPALGAEAGGSFATDPTDPQQLRTLESLFLFDVVPTAPSPDPIVGERVLVRFDHGDEPVAFRLLRVLRQLFLARFDV
jgi:putative peptide zinc metalloprotease protein